MIDDQESLGGVTSWPNILDIDKDVHELQSSDKLREFYRKLVETDAQIKNLKRMDGKSSFLDGTDIFSLDQTPDRTKRSLKEYNYPKRHQRRRRLVKKPILINDIKRNDDEEPSGFVIEKKKLIVQYKPAGYVSKKLKPKYSHVPKDSHPHENKLKQPFYKDTQRLDELLDQFLNKNLPEIMADPLGIDILFKPKNSKFRNFKPHPDTYIDPVTESIHKLLDKNIPEEISHFLEKGKQLIKFDNLTEFGHGRVTTYELSNHNTPEVISETSATDILFNQRKNTFNHLKPDEVDSIAGLNNEQQEPAKPSNKNILDSPKHIATNALYKLRNNKYKNKKTTTTDSKKKLKHEQLLKSNALTKDNNIEEYTDGIPDDRKMKLMGREFMENFVIKPELTTADEKESFRHEVRMIGEDKLNYLTTSPIDLEMFLTSSTVTNADSSSTTDPYDVNAFSKDPTVRKLMQVEEEDESLGYEDFNEVLIDNAENEEDTEKNRERKKREPNVLAVPSETSYKYHPPPGVLNPNWKGPMPLYSDELDSMIQQPTICTQKSAAEDVDANKNTNPEPGDVRLERDTNVDYMEDYLNNKNSQLFHAAQAYSDYGVLDGKKESKDEKDSVTDIVLSDHRENMDTKILSISPMNKFRKEQNENIASTLPYNILRPEDQQINVNPLSPISGYCDDCLDIKKILQHHIQFKPEPKPESEDAVVAKSTTNPNIDLLIEKKDTHDKRVKKKNNRKSLNKNHVKHTYIDIGDLFSKKGKRSLLSTNEETEYQNLHQMIATPLKKKYVINDDSNKINSQNVEPYPHFLSDLMDVESKTHEMTNDSVRNYILNNNIQLFNIPPSVRNLHNDVTNQPNIVTTSKIDEDLDTYFMQDESVVTIDNTENQVDDSNTLQGKICLKVNNSVFGTENIVITFDFSLMNISNDIDGSINDKATPVKSDKQEKEVQKETIKQLAPKKVYYVERNLLKKTKPHFLITNKIPNRASNSIINKRNKRSAILDTSKQISENNNDLLVENNTSIIHKEYNKTLLIKENINDSNISTNHKNVNLIHNDMTKNHTNKTADIFSMICDWFCVFDGINWFSNNQRANKTGEYKSQQLNSSYATENMNFNNTVKDAHSHRSRALLSIQENNGTELNIEREYNITTVTSVKSSDVSFNENSNVTSATSTQKINVIEKDEDNKTTALKTDGNKTKTIVKRNAEASNGIFWNDMYDDEYGVKTDILDTAMEDTPKQSDFIKRSGRWVHEKLKKFAANWRGSTQSHNSKLNNRNPRAIKIKKRSQTQVTGAYDESDFKFSKKMEEQELEHNNVFSYLANNMKEVCKKAARAVQQTRNLEVKEDPKQGTIATSLMQQLVRLMTDLVDYQVQQRTCTSLPPDLQQFLAWLTNIEDPPESQSEYVVNVRTPYEVNEDLLQELENLPGEISTTEPGLEVMDTSEVAPDMRELCQDSIRAVRELLDTYETMNDDEKSRMSGIKNYLNNQMKFLNKKMADFDQYNTYEMNNNLRFKRFPNRIHQIQKRLKRKAFKFMNNFGKKHTRTTASFYDGVQITDKRIFPENDNKLEENDNFNDNEDKFKGNANLDGDGVSHANPIEKRNLRDIYYKAVADAKTYVTLKSVHEDASTFSPNVKKDFKDKSLRQVENKLFKYQR